VTAAMFGTLTTPLMYGITRNWGGSVYSGILCASLFLMDNLNLTESRLILVDSQLIFWCAAALFVAQMWWRRLTEHDQAMTSWAGRFGCDVSRVDDERKALQPHGDGCPTAVEIVSNTMGDRVRMRVSDVGIRQAAAHELSMMMGERDRWAWVVAMGVATSSAISIKWTALATPGMIAVESFFGFFFLRVRFFF
jgi:dolichyl-phosphate-mannose--protein O-mannosyl transferase